jgi:RNA polymerase sigma-70 factor, ECF subfamily
MNQSERRADNPSVAARRKERFGEGFESVLLAAQAGGDWAWRELYSFASPAAYGYLRVRGAADPDDLLGEVFLHVVRGIGAFSGNEAAFRAWVLTITHRRLVDDVRKRAVRPEVVWDGDLESLGPIGDVEREAIAGIEASRALEAIRELSPDQQDVVLLRLLGDLSLEQVAGVVGKTVGAVKQLQHRAYAMLGKKLAREAVTL